MHGNPAYKPKAQATTAKALGQFLPEQMRVSMAGITTTTTLAAILRKNMKTMPANIAMGNVKNMAAFHFADVCIPAT